MKKKLIAKSLVIFLFTFSWTGVLGQIIIITKYSQKVPQGKKWTLTSNMQPLIEVNEGTLNSGTLCNANILSNPRNLATINEGDYGNPNKSYGIDFKGLTKVAYTNNLTYKISSILSFLCYDHFNVGQDNKISEQSNITFYPGQTISLSGCLETIEFLENDLSQTDLKMKKIFENEKKQIDGDKELNKVRPDAYKNSPSGGSGISIVRGLSGRRPIHFPNMKGDFNENAKVYVDIKVDASGKVVSATVARGTTTSNSSLRDIATQKAYELKFPPAQNNIESGTLLFNFVLKF